MSTLKGRFFIPVLLLLAGKLALPEMALAAEEGNKWGIRPDVGKFLNLLLAVAVLIWAARKPGRNLRKWDRA